MKGRNVADYYKVLGVAKSSDMDTIKKAYRKLALQYHPDRNAGDKAAEAKFKEISEAYAVLSDPEKKRQYDTFGSNQFHQKYSSDDIFRGADFSHVFNDFDFGGGFENIFSRFFGGAGAGQSARKAQDIELDMEIDFMTAYLGEERPLRFSLSNGEQRELQIKIPAGVQDGGRLRVAGKGASASYGGTAGDLFINIRVAPHLRFRRNEQDVEVDLPVKISEAILGGSKSVPIPSKSGTEEKKIKIPAGVQDGTRIRLKGLGFPALGSHKQGDLYAIVHLEVPRYLNDAQMQAVQTLQTLGL